MELLLPSGFDCCDPNRETFFVCCTPSLQLVDIIFSFSAAVVTSSNEWTVSQVCPASNSCVCVFWEQLFSFWVENVLFSSTSRKIVLFTEVLVLSAPPQIIEEQYDGL